MLRIAFSRVIVRNRVVHFNRLKPYRGDQKPTWFDDSMARTNDSIITLPGNVADDSFISASAAPLADVEESDAGSEDSSNGSSGRSDIHATRSSNSPDNPNPVSRRGRHIVKPSWHRDYAMQS